jgi:hypothetical protein
MSIKNTPINITNHSSDELYYFDFILCDNEIDQSFERFSVSAICTLAQMYKKRIGTVSCIGIHNETVRILDTYIQESFGRLTKAGETYICAKARAYIVKTEKNAALICKLNEQKEIMATISCSIKGRICSKCFKERYLCSHTKGKRYIGELCHTILHNPIDVYGFDIIIKN